MNRLSAYERYRRELALTESNLHRHHQQAGWLVAIRMLLFLIAGYFLITGYMTEHRSVVWIAIGWGATLAFLIAAAIHERIQQAIQVELVQRRLFRCLIARVDRNWEELAKAVHLESNGPSSAEADDLDLTGERSLFRWCSLAGTPSGSKVLTQQLTGFSDASTILHRQAAVRELASQLDIRMRLMLQLWQLGAAEASLEDFSQWASVPMVQKPWINRLTWIGPACFVSGMVAIILAITTTLPSTFLWLGLIVSAAGLLTNTLLVLGFVGVLHNAFKQVATHRELEATCQELLRSLVELQPQASLLNELRSTLCDPDSEHSAIAALRKLRWPMRLAGLRLHPSLYILFLILQVGLLWDFRIYQWLEGWRACYAAEVGRWINSIGQLEAILSAAAIHDENPHWSFPDFDLPDGQLFEARQLGHPLISDSMRVVNNLSIAIARPLLLVTGSNMSGKSTLMRTVGVNVALARIGAPVCAEKFLCPPLEIATSIRVRDSLADGVSFFMAELKRLRQVVDEVQKNRELNDRPTLVILDEILQGTNSQERQIAVSHVVKTLLEFPVLLMVSTHDLLLAETDGFSDNCQIVHFREHFENIDGKPRMLFDYRMHPGIAPTTNALKLLELVGLGNIPIPRRAKPIE